MVECGCCHEGCPLLFVGLGFWNRFILVMSLPETGLLSVKWPQKILSSMSSGACPCKMLKKCLVQLQSWDHTLYLGAERAELCDGTNGRTCGNSHLGRIHSSTRVTWIYSSCGTFALAAIENWYLPENILRRWRIYMRRYRGRCWIAIPLFFHMWP